MDGRFEPYRHEAHEVKDLFKQWLSVHAPLAQAHVMARIREARGGKENDPNFGTRMVGHGPYADMIRRRFKLQCRRLGLNRERVELDIGRFTPPPVAGEQLDLFTR